MSGSSGSTPAVLLSQMDPPPGGEADFHDWYEHEHIPARMVIPGFIAARRYVVRSGAPRFLAVYDMIDLDVLGADAYVSLKRCPSPRTERMLATVAGFTRYCGELVSDTGDRPLPPWLSVVAFVVPERDRREFDDWYEDEHIPLLMGSPLWWRVRRYALRDRIGGAWTDVALHEVATKAAMDARERDLARRAPRRRALAGRPWFSESGRWLYELISNHTHSPSALTVEAP